MSPGKNLFTAARIGAAAALLALGAATSASAQVPLLSATSRDGLLSLFMSADKASDATGVNTTYTWTARNNSATVALTGVVLGSHWGDWCGGGNCTPPGPTLVSAGPGCAGQGASDIPLDAKFGLWCTPLAGVTLLPGESVSGSVTLRPGAGGPPDYTVYSNYIDPQTGASLTLPFTPVIERTDAVAPAATDIQIKGSASNGSPAAGSTYSYTFEVKNAGPWGTYGGIVVTDSLPASLTVVGALVSPPGASKAPNCTALGQTVTCLLNDLQNGSRATVTLTVVASGNPQQIVNTASAATVAPQTDSTLSNNSASVTVTTK